MASNTNADGNAPSQRPATEMPDSESTLLTTAQFLQDSRDEIAQNGSNLNLCHQYQKFPHWELRSGNNSSSAVPDDQDTILRDATCKKNGPPTMPVGAPPEGEQDTDRQPPPPEPPQTGPEAQSVKNPEQRPGTGEVTETPAGTHCQSGTSSRLNPPEPTRRRRWIKLGIKKFRQWFSRRPSVRNP